MSSRPNMQDSDPIARIESDAKSKTSGPNFFVIGLVLTALYLIMVLGFAAFAQSGILAMKPNEWGDFLAGIFGPLALLWVVLGFLQQGAELRYSRDALLLQARELRASVEAQKNMGEAAWAGVNLERDSLSVADQERIRGIQPVFMIHNYSFDNNGMFKKTIFSLSNSGRDGIGLYLELLDADYSVYPSKFSKFTNQERVQIAIQTAATTDYVDCRLLLQYRDLEGRPSSRVFHLSADSGGLEVDDELGHEFIALTQSA